ncbi:ferredoxin [Candidatus Woesearchaeota archaeon]|nr:ferredoxin [Candidatus Woesearchaeota archaeon]RLE43428.1 MAG: ferredoxin [Candidatus Woesearchaeota archaeon]
MAYKIKFNEEECIGCGACVAVCGENWELKDGKAHPKKTEVEEKGCNEDAAETCPMNCISIEEV